MGKLTLYLADDDTDDRVFFREALQEITMQTEVSEFSNGVDLMDALFTKEKLPDAVFLDLRMPLMDGFECLLDIRNFPKFDSIKIIVYSTSFHEREVNQLKEDGANHYLQKPNSFQELKSLLFQSIKILESGQNNADTSGEFILLTQPS